MGKSPDEKDFLRAGGRPVDLTSRKKFPPSNPLLLLLVVLLAVAGAFCLGTAIILLFSSLFPI